MRHVFRLLVVGTLLVATVYTVVRTDPVFAQCSNKEECSSKIEEYEKKLSELKSQKSTLSSQIQLMTTQMNLAAIKINQTEELIETTSKEVDVLGTRITDLNASLDTLSNVLLHKIIEGYKRRNVSIMKYVLDSDEANNLLNESAYINAAKRSDQVLALRLQQSKVTFQEQKDLREKKMKELEDLKKTLDQQRKDLDAQKLAKQSILTQTNSEEGKYQKLLEQALSEYNAIERATATGQKIGPVKKGDPIALVGNTGYPYCSTGPHLHFEVRKNGTWVDPNSYLSSGWSMPLSDPVEITQGFGHTPWSWRYTYSGGIHTGLDMISGSSNVIRAPADGTLYSSSQPCQSATIRIKYIDHGEGLISYYLHVRE